MGWPAFNNAENNFLGWINSYKGVKRVKNDIQTTGKENATLFLRKNNEFFINPDLKCIGYFQISTWYFLGYLRILLGIFVQRHRGCNLS